MGEPINYRLWAFYYSILVLSRMNESTIKTLRKICGIQSLNQWIIWTLGRRQIYLCDDDDDETNVIDNLSTLSSDFGKSVGSDEIEKEWNISQRKHRTKGSLKWFWSGFFAVLKFPSNCSTDGFFFRKKCSFRLNRLQKNNISHTFTDPERIFWDFLSLFSTSLWSHFNHKRLS